MPYPQRPPWAASIFAPDRFQRPKTKGKKQKKNSLYHRHHPKRKKTTNKAMIRIKRKKKEPKMNFWK